MHRLEDAEFYKRGPRKDGGPPQQTPGADRLSRALQDPGVGVGLGHRELWALETDSDAESCWESWRKPQRLQGHAIGLMLGAEDADPQVFLEGCDGLSMHMLRVQTESRPD